MTGESRSGRCPPKGSTWRFVPRGEGYVPYRDETVHAVRINITDRDAYQPVWLTLVLLSEIKQQHPADFKVTNVGMTQMLGSYWAREAFDRGEDPRVIRSRWESQLDEWEVVRDKYLLYEE